MADAVRSLYHTDPVERHAQILTREESRALFDRVVAMTGGKGDTKVAVSSVWRGNLRWALNEVTTSGDTFDHNIMIIRRIRGAESPSVVTNRLDDASLRRALDVVEYRTRFVDENLDAAQLVGPQSYANPPIFAESTIDLVSADRSRIGRQLTQGVADAGLIAAGYIAVQTESLAVYDTDGLDAYAKATNAQYSVTVRDRKGSASGWAGKDHTSWTNIDAAAITATAQRKCVTSANAVAVEPGRYVAILEPQAVHDLMQFAIGMLDRPIAETTPGPYHLSPDQSKIGLRLLDPRVNITADCMDPDCSFMPFDYDGEPYRPATWFDRGVLHELPYDRRYGVPQMGDTGAFPRPGGYRMTGGTATVDEMIASTKRGVLVTRLSGMRMVDPNSITVTGVTRDGLWLVENGKISKAIKNFRFNESPLFTFNAIEMLGAPIRVFSPRGPAVVPPVKVREFNFVGLADAV